MNETRFGKYRLMGVVGSGGLATVYRAADEELQREVALKVLNANWPTDSVVAQRFRRELDIAQRLHHPNIISIYEYGEVNERLYLAMEFMAKGSLSRHFSKPTPIRLGATARIIQAVASALDYAHSQQVIHRDLKMENILIGENNRIVLSDFGIAYVPSSNRLTVTGDVFGTPLYIPPEQLVGTKAVDARADCYSLAVIAYLLSVGYFPFSSESPLETLNRHLVSAPPVPSHLNPRLPNALNVVLLRGLAKDPNERYQSAGEFATVFTQAVSGAGVNSAETIVLAWQPTPISTAPQDYAGLESFLASPYKTDVIAGITPSMPVMAQSAKPKSRYLRSVPGMIAAVIIALLLLGLGSSTFTPAPTATLSATHAPTQLLTTRASLQIAQKATDTLTPTPLLTSTLSPDQMATYQAQVRSLLSFMAAMVPSTTPTPSNSPTPFETNTLRPTSTPRPTNTSTNVPTATATDVPTDTATPTRVPATRVPTATPVPPTAWPTSAPTHKPTSPPQPTSAPAQPTAPPPQPTSAPQPTSNGGLLDPILPPVVPTLVGKIL